MTIAHQLLRTAANPAFEVVDIQQDPAAPTGSVTIHLEIDEADIEDCGIALSALFVSDAPPAGASPIDFEDDDAWTMADFVTRLLFPGGPDVEPGEPYLVQRIEGVELWLLWVSDPRVGG